MKKIIVIGCPGSGKSIFSIKLAEKTSLPLFHLDMLRWNDDRTMIDREVFLCRLNDVLALDKWIIDGNYGSTMEMRMALCDTVIFLDYETDICIKGVEERMGKPRPDMPWIETERDEEFMEYIRNYNTVNRPNVIALLEKYCDKNVVVFKSRQEADRFLTEVGK